MRLIKSSHRRIRLLYSRPRIATNGSNRAHFTRSESQYCVVGGGIAGLCIARALYRAGASVAIVERDSLGRGAGFQAAGMLAPMVEARLQERGVLEFMLESLAYYRRFAT